MLLRGILKASQIHTKRDALLGAMIAAIQRNNSEKKANIFTLYAA
jgi:hypothetical protein